jgi:prevent-host-death family protein
LKKRTKKLLHGCRGLAGDSHAKVFASFFKKKCFLPSPQADERRVQDFSDQVKANDKGGANPEHGIHLPSHRLQQPGAGSQIHLSTQPHNAKLVSMTKIVQPPVTPARPSGSWPLQDAKARFSELVRRVRSEGPQHITVHRRDAVVVISAEEFRRLKGDRTGNALIAVMQDSPYPDIDIAPPRAPMPARSTDL